MDRIGNRSGKRFMVTSLLMLSLAGCSFIPDYERPESPTPSKWTSDAPRGQTSSTSAWMTADTLGWRDFFNDERLQSLIAVALENNRDLRVAALNIEYARAAYQIQASDLYPKIGVSATQRAQRIPSKMSPTGSATVSRQYTALVGMSEYEIDIFGRIHAQEEQALQKFFASEQARDSVHISLIAQIANAYMLLIADRDHLQLAKDTLQSQLESYRLTQRRFELGAASGLELRQIETTVESARVDVAHYTQIVAQDENLLALLIGTNEIPAELLPSEPLSDMTAITSIPDTLDSDILLERPDIKEAEHQLIAANASIGAARAAFFPRITLQVSGGTMSTELTQLFKGGAGTWNFIPFISLPIFSGGQLTAVLESTKVDREIKIARYEQAIQNAFSEVADALASFSTLDEQIQAQQALTAASEAAYRLAEARFRGGIDSYLSALDSQRAMYRAQQGLIGVRLQRQIAAVTLYKALGGGRCEYTGRHDAQNDETAAVEANDEG